MFCLCSPPAPLLTRPAPAARPQKFDRLEAELAASKANSVKARGRCASSLAHLAARAPDSCTPPRPQESIRLGHTDLGDYAAARGDLAGAFKAYVRSRDYCTTSAHVVAMCLAVIRVTAELHNFTHVANYVQKAESAVDAAADPLTTAKARVCTLRVLAQHCTPSPRG